MKKLSSYIHDRWYVLSILCILSLAVMLRFANYENRWGLAYDQAHDAVIARYAIQEGKIPLVGPFSSAGPFQTGGEWYWLLMILTAFYPPAIVTPWIGMTVLYVIFVGLMVLVATMVFGKKGGILAGLFSAVSTAQIVQGVNLTNQSPLALIGLGALWSSFSYIQTKNIRFAFLLGLFVGLGATIHLQGVGLGALIVMTAVVTLPRDYRWYMLAAAGFFIPFIPLIIYDIENDFINISGFFQYYLHDQYKIPFEVLGRRWLTYASEFWPGIWGYVIGGHSILGGLFMVSVGAISLWHGIQKKLSKEIILLLGSGAIMATLLRYTRTPLFESYVVFMHPVILLLSVWVVKYIGDKSRMSGVVTIVVILTLTLQADIKHILTATNRTAILMDVWRNELTMLYSGEKFSVYDRTYITSSKSMPLVLYLNEAGLFHEDGRKIGVMYATMSGDIHHPVLYEEAMVGELVDISSSTSGQLAEAGWIPMGPSEIYRTTQHWYQSRRKTGTP